MSTRPRIGELLVSAGVLTHAQLDEAVAIQQRTGTTRRLGTLLVDRGYLSEPELVRVLSQQLAVPTVSLGYVEFSRKLLALVPEDVAERHCVIPVYVRRERGAGDTLYLAVEDPTHEEALLEVADAAGMPVRPMIAPPSDIRAAIRAYYAPPERISAPEARVAPRKGALELQGVARVTDDGPELDLADEVDVEDLRDAEGRGAAPEPQVLATPAIPTPPPARRKGPRKDVKMIALTLLDGTQIKIPAPRRQRAGAAAPASEQPAAEELPTTGDLVAALRAVAQGAQHDEVLGDVRWEKLFAAMLNLLMKKQVISDWEFVEELRKL